MSGQQQFEFFGGPEEEQPDIPLVYLAMPLSHLEKREREHVQLLAYTITRAIDDASQESATDPWRVSVHSPARRSAPWQDDSFTPEDVFRLNSRTVWEEADALVVIGYEGGSLGSGQELAWAASLALPTLYVHNEDTAVSRQLRGAAAEHDLTIAAHRSPHQLADLVERWLCSRRHLIADGPRRRRNRALLFVDLQTRLRCAWEALGRQEQGHVVAVTRTARDRIVRLLDSAGAFSQASLAEIASLTAALEVDATSLAGASPLPDLRGEQRAALVNAAEEFGWDTQETFRLYDAARVELARGGIRRLPLASPYDWRVFRERLGNGH
jgi:hypothetical protein